MNPAYRPMLATLVDEPFDDKGWVFETKWDGFRLVTEKRGDDIRLWSRNGIDVTTRYAVLLPALQKIEGSCVIDGELCALDAHGRSRFQLLQNALNKESKLLYVVFDALFVGGKDIRDKPLLERKKILKSLLPRDPLLRYSEHVTEFGTREFANAQRAHEEGLIAKRAAGLYYSGKRTREWLKFKAVYEQEIVIVGYTKPRRSRKYFGSLVLAVRDQATKRWVYAGHGGTGFNQAMLKSLYGKMRPLETAKKPFDQKVKHENDTTWLTPKLVGEVKFTEWTSEGEMRHPAFLGLRARPSTKIAFTASRWKAPIRRGNADYYLFSPRGVPYTETSLRARWHRWLNTEAGQEVCRRWQAWLAEMVRKYEWEIDPAEATYPTIHGLRGTGILMRRAIGHDVDQIANDIGMSRQMVERYMRFRDQMEVAATGQARLKLINR